MKTKETIIDEEFSDNMVNEITGYKLQFVKDAMDEFARQQAIEFDIWKIKNHWTWHTSLMVYFKWEGENTHETRYSIEELYSQFLKTQQ